MKSDNTTCVLSCADLDPGYFINFAGNTCINSCFADNPLTLLNNKGT